MQQAAALRDSIGEPDRADEFDDAGLLPGERRMDGFMDQRLSDRMSPSR